MWTFDDNVQALEEGWRITAAGVWPVWGRFDSWDAVKEHIKLKASQESHFHIKALQHLALCKLLDISPAPKD